MKFRILACCIIMLLTVITTNSFGTDSVRNRCATVENTKRLASENPEYMQNRLRDRQFIQQLEENRDLSNARIDNSIYTIPVVVHVIYRTTAQNISDAQIQSQIAVLNEDFARLNADTANTPSFFKPVAGSSGFRFCLARQDPDGNPTNGIQRRSTTLTSFNSNDNMKHFSSGGLDSWDVSRYFNIWVCNLGNFILGYAEPAASTHSNTYGVVVLYDSFGKVGNVAAPYNKGRTATHELGHAFGLEHIWGDDSDCTGSDGIHDTPNQEVETYGCPSSYPQFDNCAPSGNGYMFMNYMDYTDDACMNMFTAGQTARMTLVMNSFYPSLLTSTACDVIPGINERAMDRFSFSLYPNPTDGMINLDMSLMEFIGTEMNLMITDVMGRVVREETIFQPDGRIHSIDLRTNNSGIYFITMFNENYRKTVRLELIK